MEHTEQFKRPKLQMTLAVSPGWAEGRLSKNNF